MSGGLSLASVYVSLLPVVEACVVVAVPGPGRVGEVRVPADEPEAVDLDPGVLARRLDGKRRFLGRAATPRREAPPHLAPSLELAGGNARAARF